MEWFTQYASPRQREATASRRPRSGGVPSVYDQTRNIQQSQSNPATRVETGPELAARQAQEKRLSDEARQAARRIVRAPSQTAKTPEQLRQEQATADAWDYAMTDAARSALRVDADYAARAAQHYTGAPERYVRVLINRETARTDDPKIRPSPLRGETEPRSSAVGYGQFLDDDNNRKFWRSNLGRYVVGVDRMSDEEIMSYREDGPISAAMIGHRANQAAATLMGALGRKVTTGEVYLEHWAGANTAVDLIRATERNPNMPAVRFYAKRPGGTEIINSHRKEFYDENGRARSVAAFVKSMTGEFGDEVYEVGRRE